MATTVPQLVKLEDARKRHKVAEGNLVEWIDRDAIPVYIRVPENVEVYVASESYLNKVAQGASEIELRNHKLRGGVQGFDLVCGVEYLRCSPSLIEALVLTGRYQCHFFREGLKLGLDGLQVDFPKFLYKQPLLEKRQALDAVFCMSNDIRASTRYISVLIDDLYAYMEERSGSNGGERIDVLPKYDYASGKLLVALETWRLLWARNFDRLSNKNESEDADVKNFKREVIACARQKLEKLFDSPGYQGESLNAPSMADSISRLICPDKCNGNPAVRFHGRVSKAICAMIALSNRLWAGSEMTYDADLTRKAVIDEFKNSFGLSDRDAKAATQIIQPDSIRRGVRVVQAPGA